MEGGQGFVNPYNFVPLGEKPPERKPAESHEYFIGNCGRVVCRITFKSPFFIPHSEKRFRVPEGKNANQIQDDELPQWIKGCEKAKKAWEFLKKIDANEEHEMLALLRDNEGKPFIPGSSLKGAFRTVAEALSNSCLSQLEFEWELMRKPNDPEVRISKVKRYYSYRRVQSPPFVGRVKKLAEKDKPGLIEVAETYTLRRRGQEVTEAKRYKVFFAEPAHINPQPQILRNLSSFNDGDIVFAQIERLTQTIHPRPHQEIQVPVFAVRSIRPAIGQVQENERKGIIKITDVTESKKSQRFIVWPDKPDTVYFDYEAQLKYDRALREGIKKDEEEHPGKDHIDTGVGFRRKRHTLDEGDIVYFSTKQSVSTKQNAWVSDMGPVELYRILYHQSLDEILLRKHRDFLPCQDPNSLCPCCRLFGWVPPEGGEAAEKTTALKGFLHFSTARWIGDTPKTEWVTLQPLGQPHPSCWQFYLNCQNLGQNAGYNDSNATIRGRKFYWHKPKVNVERPKEEQADVNSVWDQRGGKGATIADDQNKTVELLLPDGVNASFEFTVDFENLSDADLGLLLLTLQPNLIGEQTLHQSGFSVELYHHFGMGKPLGLGSAKVEICLLTIYDSAKRYQDLMASGTQIYQKEQVRKVARKYILAFVRRALKGQGKPTHDEDDEEACREFCELPHIKALLSMLDWQKAQNLPVQYPPGGDERTGGSDPNMKEYWEAFRWFTHKNQRDFFKKPRHMLLKPEEIAFHKKQQDGFPPADLSQSQQTARGQHSHQKKQKQR